jgi:hypothetical protein
MKTTWSILAIYDDDGTRETAVQFCDGLVKRFWNQGEFDVAWVPFELLKEGLGKHNSAEKAAQADLLVFAAHPQSELPVEITGWIETWLPQRGDREGTLVDLVVPAGCATNTYLRSVAHRGGMDYLTELPQSIIEPMPDSLEFFTARAQEVSGVLEEILHQPEAQVRVRH